MFDWDDTQIDFRLAVHHCRLDYFAMDLATCDPTDGKPWGFNSK